MEDHCNSSQPTSHNSTDKQTSANIFRRSKDLEKPWEKHPAEADVHDTAELPCRCECHQQKRCLGKGLGDFQCFRVCSIKLTRASFQDISSLKLHVVPDCLFLFHDFFNVFSFFPKCYVMFKISRGEKSWAKSSPCQDSHRYIWQQREALEMYCITSVPRHRTASRWSRFF